MKKALLLTIALCLNAIVTAQQIPFKVQKSEIFSDEFRKSNIVLAEEDGNGGIIIVRSYESSGISPNSGYYFEQYNSDLKLVNSKDYAMPSPNAQKYNIVLGLFSSDGVINLIEMYYQITEKSYICYAHCLNIKDFGVEKKELFQFTREELSVYGDLALGALHSSGSYEMWKINAYAGSFFYPWSGGDFFSNKNPIDGGYAASGISLSVSKDKKSFGIALDLLGNKSEALKIYLFDNKMHKQFEHIFQPEIKDNKYHYQTLEISPDGKSLYLLGKAYNKKAKSKSKGGKYEYELTRFDKDKQESKSFDTGEYFVTSLKTIFNNNKYICLGFYSDENDKQYKGVSYFEIDPLTLDLKKATYNQFTDQFMNDKYGKEKNKALKFLSFRKILVTHENEFLLNAEEAYSNANYSNGGMGMIGGAGVGMGVTSTGVNYNYDDIISAKIDANGEMLWARNINKSQSTTHEESRYFSYSSIVKGNDNYFFINTADDVKTLSNNRIEFKDVTKGKANLVAIRVNEKGDFVYQEILDNEKNEVPFMVSNGIESNGSIYFLGRKGKKKQLLKLTLF